VTTPSAMAGRDRRALPREANPKIAATTPKIIPTMSRKNPVSAMFPTFVSFGDIEEYDVWEGHETPVGRPLHEYWIVPFDDGRPGYEFWVSLPPA